MVIPICFVIAKNTYENHFPNVLSDEIFDNWNKIFKLCEKFNSPIFRASIQKIWDNDISMYLINAINQSKKLIAEKYNIKENNENLIHTDIIDLHFNSEQALSIENSILHNKPITIKEKNSEQCEVLNLINNYLVNKKFNSNYKKIAAICIIELEKLNNLEQAKFFINLNSLKINNQEIRNRFINIKINLIRYLFNDKKFDLLLRVCEFECGSIDDELYGSLCCLMGHVYHFMHQDLKAQKYYLLATNNISSESRGYYYLGKLTKKKIWFEKGSKLIFQDLWSLLCKLECQDSPHFISLLDISIKNKSGDNDHYIINAYKSAINSSFNSAINNLFSIKKKDYINPSQVFISIIQKFKKIDNVCYLIRIGMLFYKKTGRIIKDCFPIFESANQLFKLGKLTPKELILSLSIIEAETKFYLNKDICLDNGYALGSMQIGKTEIVRICQNRKISYNKDIILNDTKLNILLGLDLFRYLNKTFCYQNFIFTIAYYHCGHSAYDYLIKFQYLNFKDPLNIFILLDMYLSKRTRGYIYHIMESFIIFWYLHYSNSVENLDPNFFCKDILS